MHTSMRTMKVMMMMMLVTSVVMTAVVEISSTILCPLNTWTPFTSALIAVAYYLHHQFPEILH